MQGGRERAPVAIPESLKALLESLLVPAEESHFFADMLVGAIFVFRGKKVHRQGRHDGSRPEIRSKHGENHRFGEGHKEEFRDAGQEEHRNEYDANANRRNERRHGNLRCAVQDGLHGLFSHGQVAVDVFNLHGGVVDQDADGKRQAPQSHDVDRFSQGAQGDDAHQDGQRNGDGDDQRAFPVPEEKQNHDRG